MKYSCNRIADRNWLVIQRRGWRSGFLYKRNPGVENPIRQFGFTHFQESNLLSNKNDNEDGIIKQLHINLVEILVTFALIFNN